MIPLLFILIAVLAYALGALSGAGLLSRFVFHKDLRKCGNGRVTYANFVRVHGGTWGPVVVAVDILKSAIAVFAGGLITLIISSEGEYVVVGKLFAGLCVTLGQMYPIQHQLRGGKGVVSCMTCFWLTDWRLGLVATGVFIITVAFSQYVSLAGMAGCLLGALSAWVFIPSENLRGVAGALAVITAAVIIWRHRGNIIKIMNKREPKVKWGGGSSPRRPKEDRF